ncbi:MAG: HEAT repeat domain-containing protein [Candidatus Latescibacteria bacterium]|nr:HEAT repeat domain-containing protein [Candidatus Latescibacterota bacterium]
MRTNDEVESESSVPYTSPDCIVQDFASRGLVLLAPESLGISPDVHERVYTKEKAAYLAKDRVTPARVPDILDVLNAPGLVAACNQLVGENWAIVPFTHNASFTSGSRDQHWHKDDNGPYNGRKQRHHQAVQIEMLYYPQPVSELMGPTATMPFSQYWTFNHEENHDNFAGADHLDFAYMLTGMEGRPVSGPDSEYDLADIQNQRTAHDVRMREAVINTGWPLVKQFEAAPLQRGSVLLYSHNTFHRGNHRRDDWRTWEDNPRFMWRFWLYRTTEVSPSIAEEPVDIDWNGMGVDPLTQIDVSDVSDDVTTVWRYHHHWLKTGAPPSPRPEMAELAGDSLEQEAKRLYHQIQEKHDEGEPMRVGAAYKLASIGDTALAVEYLARALYDERESVRRAATYGLVAVGREATETFLTAAASPIKWVRKAGIYGLGDASPLTDQVFQVVEDRLRNDSSVYIRSVAAGTLGCLGRRAVATGIGLSLVPDCMEALVASLAREENRPGMDIAQGRSIKYVRPTDDCDICEGVGIDLGLERFDLVRSAVRENVLWSIVILCSHGLDPIGSVLGSTVDALKLVVAEDRNVINVGFAMDALNRLVNLGSDDDQPVPLVDALRRELPEIFRTSPAQAWEAVVRGGIDDHTTAVFGIGR